jgi:hypothetical protein
MQPLSTDQRYAILRQSISSFLNIGYTIIWQSHNAACLVRPEVAASGDDNRKQNTIWKEDLLCFTVDRFGNVERE